jgi:excisionase family DNA binding protein
MPAGRPKAQLKTVAAPPTTDTRYFTVSEAAEYLRVRRWTVAAAIREKSLPYVHLGKKYILLREDLDAFATANRVAA